MLNLLHCVQGTATPLCSPSFVLPGDLISHLKASEPKIARTLIH